MGLIYDKSSLQAKAEKYSKKNNTMIARELGFGTQGIVYKTLHNTAIKVHALERNYRRERDVYIRLKERDIQSVRGLMIPRIVNWDDVLSVFEMSIVHVPCLLDFGGAYLDIPPEHMVRDKVWRQEKAEEFGDNWDEAQAVIREIEHLAGIYNVDVKTGNIKI